MRQVVQMPEVKMYTRSQSNLFETDARLEQLFDKMYHHHHQKVAS